MKMQKHRTVLRIALIAGLGILPTLPAIFAQQSQPQDSKPAAQQPRKGAGPDRGRERGREEVQAELFPVS